MNFWHLLRVVKSRTTMISSIVVVTLAVVFIAAPKPKVVYQAEVYMQPTPQVMNGGLTTTADRTNASLAPDRSVILSNLIVLARSGTVMDRALDFLVLSKAEQEAKEPGLRFYKSILRIEVDGKPIDYNAWRDVLEVQPVYMEAVGKEGTTTDVIRLTVTLVNGEDAPYLADAVGYAFAEAYREKSKEGTRKTKQFLESLRTETFTKLQRLRAEIAAYKTQHQVISVDAETQASLTSLTSLEASRDNAAAEVRQAEAAVADLDKQLKSQPLVRKETLPGDLNPVVVKLKEDLVKAESDLQELSMRYKPVHPTYQAAQTRITYLRGRIAQESANYAPPFINQIHQTLLQQRSDASYKLATARAKIASLEGSVGRAQAKIDNLARAEPQLVNLMTECAQVDNSYKMISQKLEETRISEKETTTTGSIVPMSWAAFPATGPIVRGPSRKELLVWGFLLSLILGVALAVWLDSIDDRMRNAGDVERLLELPVLGLTPKLTGRDGNLPRLTHIYPLSAMAESYKIMRTNILFAMRDNPFKTLMVATGRPGQGATTTVCNLAIALAQIGKRIILIDADMRRPSLHKFFGLSNEAGLSTLLQGNGNVTEAFQTTDIPNLILMPAGPQPTNPSELIGSERMREIVERLEEHCDLVMFDTPSTIVFSDGPMLASWIDAVIMVVSANQAPRGTETLTRDLLRRAKANILGVVVNRMSPENVDSCYYYSHYYSDSVPGDTPMLDLPKTSGNGHGPDSGANNAPLRQSKPKAIPAASGQPNPEPDENPFPD